MGAYTCQFGFVHKTCRCPTPHTIACDKVAEHGPQPEVVQVKRMAVRDLYVQCSLQVRNFDSPGIAMSDCCGLPALTAVEMEDGKKMWRCTKHEGIRSMSRGNVFWDFVSRLASLQYTETEHKCPECETPLTKMDVSTMLVCDEGHGPYFLV